MKIGITTHYYKSTNYGGNLQAYALCKVLSNKSHRVEQISIVYNASVISNKNSLLSSKSLKDIVKSSLKFPLRILKRTIIKYKNKQYNICDRAPFFENFNTNLIPHSTKVYGADNIAECVNDYDAFITGSDQVWNMEWYYAPYFLDFVPSSKIKLSYAASLGASSIQKEPLEIFKKSLSSYKAVSVREDAIVPLLKEVCETSLISTLDPTLLLTKEEWGDVATKRLIDEEYLFCYFLGNSKSQRKIAEDYAKNHNLKIVNMAFVHGTYRRCDENFGDAKLYEISPENFLSLIKYAKIVFTDSFHAVVFSGIFQRDYIVFHRDGAKAMGSRIYTLLSLYEAPERFCDIQEKESLSYIEKLSKIDYTRKLEKLEQKRKESIDFLLENLK